MHPPSQLFLKFLARMRSGRVFRLSWKWPCRNLPQMNVKPRKLKVSGLPSPRCRRVTPAKRQGFFTSYLNAEAQKSQPALHEAIAYALCHAA
jgi:hypothetical protein